MDCKCRMGERMYTVSEAPITAARRIYVGGPDRPYKKSKRNINGKEEGKYTGRKEGQEREVQSSERIEEQQFGLSNDTS